MGIYFEVSTKGAGNQSREVVLIFARGGSLRTAYSGTLRREGEGMEGRGVSGHDLGKRERRDT